MAEYLITDPQGGKYKITAPDDASQEDVMKYAQANFSKAPGVVADTLKGAPRSALAGILDAATSGAQAEAHAMSQPELAADIPNTEQALKAVQPLTGQLYESQTVPGKIIGSGIRAVTNPASYIGPGGMALKVGGAALSGAGSEAGSEYAGLPGSIVGSIAGGAAGVKAFGPAAERAAIPKLSELNARAEAGYNAARNSGVEFSPTKLAEEFAIPAQQDLMVGKHAFTSGPDGTAPKTLALLDRLATPPEGATVTASNMDTLRKQIGNIAGEVGSNFRPTSDAKAAMVLKRKLDAYWENPPEGHIVAGNAEDFSRPIRQANGDKAAYFRASTVDEKVANAQRTAEGGIATAEDNQIKSKIRQIINNKKAQRGYSPEEIEALNKVNAGTNTSNVFRQLGRGGTGVIPMSLHAASAFQTGGASLPVSLAIGTPLYASKKIAQALTRRHVNQASDLLRQRSPEYQARVAEAELRNTLANPQRIAANKAAIIRALLNAR